MWLRSEVGVSAIALAPILLDLPPLFLRYAARDRHQVRRRPASGGNRASSAALALHGADGGYHWPRWVIGPISISYLEALRGFGGYHGLGRSAGEGVERQAPQPGEDRGGEVPHAAADGDSPLHPAVPARDPPRRPLGWPPVRRAGTHASSRQRSCAPGLGLRRDGWGA